MLLFGGIVVNSQAQQVNADQAMDNYTSYDFGSRAAEANPLASDVLKAEFAERMNANLSTQLRMKGAVDHPALGAHFKHYTPNNTGSNGLSDVRVRFVEEDSQGKLYFSTSGMDIWNGFGWENHNPSNSPIPNMVIHDMLEDRMGNIWLATFSGLARVDGESGDFQIFNEVNGLISPLVLTLHEAKDGRIFAGHRWNETFGGGVSVLNAYGSVNYTFNGEQGLFGESVEDFAESDGKIYIATGADPTNGESGGITVYDLRGDSVITAYHKDNSDLPTNEVGNLAVDQDGNLWAGLYTNSNIGNTEGGIVKFDGTSWTHFSQENGDNVGVDLRDLHVDSNGDLWIASVQGVHKYDGSTFTEVVAEADIPMIFLADVNELSDGRMTFSTFNSFENNGGVHFYDPATDSWEYISSSTDNGANSQIYFGADYDSKGNLWVTGFYGLQKFDGSKWETWTAADGLAYTYGWDLIVDSNDNVWVNSTENGLTRINADGSIDTITDHGFFVESNYEATNGDMWFGDYYGDYNNDGTLESNGILHYDGSSYTVYDSTNGLPTGSAGAVISISEDQQGRILAATHDGLYRLEGGSFTKWEFEGYNGGPVFKLHLDSQNRLWINDGSRTSLLDGVNWQYFDAQDGIDGWVEDIEEDMSGRVWLAQPDGAVVYDNGKFHRVSPKNGIPTGGYVYDLAPSRTDAGTMAFAIYNGGIVVMESELPVFVSDISDNPDDQGNWIRVQVGGYLLSQNYTGDGADAWRVEVNMDGNWESASPVSPASSNSISVQVSVTKPTGVTADETNSYEFRVVALNEEEGVVGVSETVTGFAEDNIAPAKVQSLTSEKADGNITLSWQGVDDNDLSGYEVYDASVSDFSASEPIASTTNLSIEIEDKSYDELLVVSKDIHNNYGAPVATMIETSNDQVTGLPKDFELNQNYPNPFNPTTKISYALPQNSHVRISVYNSIGQQVAVLMNEVRSAGNHQVNFNAAQLNSGMYIYKIEAGNFTQTRKMMLIK